MRARCADGHRALVGMPHGLPCCPVQPSYALTLELSEQDKNFDDKLDVLELNGLQQASELVLRADAPPPELLLPLLRLLSLQGEAPAPFARPSSRAANPPPRSSACSGTRRRRRSSSLRSNSLRLCRAACRRGRVPAGVHLPQRGVGAHAAARERGERARVLPGGAWHGRGRLCGQGGKCGAPVAEGGEQARGAK